MKRFGILMAALAAISVVPGFCQLGLFDQQQRADITREWKGERFPDGRPKVPDDVLARLKNTTAEEAWGTLRRHGYRLQFVGDWKTLNVGPGQTAGGPRGDRPVRALPPGSQRGGERSCQKRRPHRARPELLGNRHSPERGRSGGGSFRQDQGRDHHRRQSGHFHHDQDRHRTGGERRCAGCQRDFGN